MKRLKSRLASLLVFVMAFGSVFSGLGMAAVAAAPVMAIPQKDVIYHEKSGPKDVLAGLDVNGNGIFAGGYMQVLLQDMQPYEQLTVQTVAQAVYTPGVVSIVGDPSVMAAVYMGDDGSSAVHIGNLFPAGGGSKQGLKLDFFALDETTAITGDYSDFDNWTINKNKVILDSALLVPKGIHDGTSGGSLTFTSSVVGDVLTLGVDGSVPNGYDSAFGPEAFSPELTVRRVDALAFDLSAVAASDDYEYFGFLVDSSNHSRELVYGRGASQAFKTTYVGIPSDGNYQFRFVAGTYDRTGGKAVGASISVKNVRVFPNVPTDAVLEQIAGLVRYVNVGSAGDWTSTLRKVDVEVSNIYGEKAADQINIHLEQPLILEQVIINGNVPSNAAELIFNKPVAFAGIEPGDPIPGLTIGGKEVKFRMIDPLDATKVYVTIDEPFEGGAAVQYTPDGKVTEAADPNSWLRAIHGNDAASQPAIQEDQLVLLKAEVTEANPDQVKLTFNRPVDDGTFPDGFTFNGIASVDIISAADNDNVVVLKLAQKLGAGSLTVDYEDADGMVGSYYNPATNLLKDISAFDQSMNNGIIPLELIKVSTDPSDPRQLKLKFNKPVSEDGLTPGEAVEGFAVGDDQKPVKFVSINQAGDEIIVRLDAPYKAGDQLAYEKEKGTIAEKNSANNKLGDIAVSSLPMVSGKLSGFGLKSGGDDLALDPQFNPNNNNGNGEGYIATVPNTVTRVSISPAAYNSEDTVTKVFLNGEEIAAADWDNLGALQEGDNIVTVRVYDKEEWASDPGTPPLEEYTIIIVRATAKLASLEPSEGFLDPEFDADAKKQEYRIQVSHSVSTIQLTPAAIDRYAKIKMSINGGPAFAVASGTASKEMELAVGDNPIIVTVTDAEGDTKEYKVTVNRPAFVLPINNTETITTDVVIGGDQPTDIVKVDITRTKEADGRIHDQVTFTTEKANETVEKAKETGDNIARIVIPDPEDIVTETRVDIPKETLDILKENNIDLEIYTDHGFIRLPRASMEGLEEDFYFRLVPVRDPEERSEVEERARTEQSVREMAGDRSVQVVTRPMTIETNLSSRPVTLILPLKGVQLPSDAAERERYLNELYIVIEHSDGDKALVHGKPVTMSNRELGLQFSIAKFSTFTIIHADSVDGSHGKYMNGYPDGTFQPNRILTRAELATILVNLGAAGTAMGEGYPDVPETHWAAKAVKLVQAAGLMQGYPDGTFRPDQKLTRAEMAAFAYRFLNLAGSNNSGQRFSDVAATHWAYDYIAALADGNWIDGYPDGTFQPERGLSRAEAAVLINKLFDRGPLYGVSASVWPDVPVNFWAFREIMEASQNHDYQIRAEGGETAVALEN